MELDPLLKDLAEKKLAFRSNVASLAAELTDVRSRLASEEKAFALETMRRKAAETRAMSMEGEIGRLHTRLVEKNEQLQASNSATEKYLHKLDELRLQLFNAQATADASLAASQSAQFQCVSLQKELDETNGLLEEHDVRVDELTKKLDHLQKNSQEREFSQLQPKDQILVTEKEIVHENIGALKDCEHGKVLGDGLPKKTENTDTTLNAKDEQIAYLRDEIIFLSEHWKLKSTELESQLEKHRTTDLELKKRVLKLEFCLQDARSQLRKLQKMEEKREKSLTELTDQIRTMKQQKASGCKYEQYFWKSPGFKIAASMLLAARQETAQASISC